MAQLRDMNALMANPGFNVGLGLMSQGMQDRPDPAAGVLSGMHMAQQQRQMQAEQTRMKAEQDRKNQALQQFQQTAAGGQDVQTIAQALMSSGDPNMAIKGAQLLSQGQGGPETMFAPQMMRDEQGNVTWGQFGNRGSFTPVETGGLSPYRPPVTFDVGDKRMVLDPVTGQMTEVAKGLKPSQEIDYIEESKRTGTRATEETKNLVAAEAALPGILQQVDIAESAVDDMMSIEGMEGFTGSGAELNILLERGGTSRADFNALRDQAVNSVAMIEFDKLRGAGQITVEEVERAKRAATAIASPKISDAMFLREVNKLRKYLQTVRTNAMTKAGQAPAESAPTAGGGGNTVNWGDL